MGTNVIAALWTKYLSGPPQRPCPLSPRTGARSLGSLVLLRGHVPLPHDKISAVTHTLHGLIILTRRMPQRPFQTQLGVSSFAQPEASKSDSPTG